jgi:uncharacterized protein YceK
MKNFALSLIVLSILTLSGCSTKNNVQNDLYSDQVCYYQDDNLTKYEQHSADEKKYEICLLEQAKETKQDEVIMVRIIRGTLTFIKDIIPLTIMIGTIF